MPNQRAIARVLGINQSTVSRALRGDRSIPDETKKLIMAEVQKQAYRPNAYVSSLMNQIRSGRLVRDRSCVALLVDAESPDQWSAHHVYHEYRAGILQRADEMGFYTESFFLKAPKMSASRIDSILFSRGIKGLILTSPYLSLRDYAAIQWERYATATTGYSWPFPTDRVAHDHHANVVIAYRQLIKLGYCRISLCLPKHNLSDLPSRWLGGFAQCEHECFGKQRTPVFYGNPDDTPLATFRKWFKQARPEVLLTLIGHERLWLDALGVNIPDQLALVCLIRPTEPFYAGVEEPNFELGRMTLETVASKILHNQFGLPENPRLTLISGTWCDGASCPCFAPNGNSSPNGTPGARLFPG